MERDEMPTDYEKELLLEALRYTSRSVDVDAGVSRIWSVAKRSEVAPEALGRRNSRAWWVGYAVVACLICVSAVIYNYAPNNSVPKTRTYQTARGQTASLKLEDGTQVMLGPATTLRYDVTPSARVANLSGVAYFDVIHNNSKTFEVHAGSSIARVLGTSFQVRKYKTESSATVVVSSGRVALNTTVLNMGDIGRTTGEKVSVMHDVRTAGVLGWTQGKIVFDDVPLSEVVVELSRWFNVDFRMDESLAGQRISGTYTNRSAAEVADAIAAAISAKVVSTGNIILFSSTTARR